MMKSEGKTKSIAKLGGPPPPNARVKKQGLGKWPIEAILLLESASLAFYQGPPKKGFLFFFLFSCSLKSVLVINSDQWI